MFFFFHVGADGTVNWWIPLMIFVLTGIVPNLLDIPFFASSPPPPLRQQDPLQDSPVDAPWYENHWLWTPLVPIIACGIPAIIFYLSFTILFEARERGWLRTLNNWLLQHVPGFPAFFAMFEQFAGAIPMQNHPRRRQTYEQRFAKVTSAIQQSPTETYHTHEDLRQLSIHELKELIHNRKLDSSGAVERGHLVDILLEAGGSTGDSCSICLDDYESGDVLRRLSCGHKFHIECVDKWALSALDYSRDPACPVCNAVIAGVSAKQDKI